MRVEQVYDSDDDICLQFQQVLNDRESALLARHQCFNTPI